MHVGLSQAPVASCLCFWHAALRSKWGFAVSLDPSRAHNQLCLMNDFTGVPDCDGEPNVDWLEVEDRCENP